MRKAALAVLSGLALIASSSVTAQQLARPPAPVVTVGANIKELTFDWNPVPGAYTYWVMEKKDARSYFTPIGVRIPAWRTRAAAPVAVHLQNWAESRYAIAACNTAGCTSSAPINPQPLLPETMGYFKASNTGAHDRFGSTVVLSADGSTLAVGAGGEASNATGVNGNQTNNSTPGSGAVYVYRREGRRWKQEAYLKSVMNQANQLFGVSYPYDQKAIAVSGDGSWVAVGAPGETVNGVGISGGVYLFRRASDGAWSLHTALRGPESFARAANSFGYSVEFTEDGRTLKVNSSLPADVEANYEGRTHIYDFDGTAWQRTATVGPAAPGYFCSFVRMSGDGSTLASMCYLYPSGDFRLTTRKRSGNSWVLVGDQQVGPSGINQMTALSFDGKTLALQEGNEPDEKIVAIYRWNGSVWTPDSAIPGPTGLVWLNWGTRVEFDRNAARLVVGSQLPGVVVFERTANATNPWRQRSIVTPLPSSGAPFAGRSIALSANGYYLAVGDPGERSNATGIDGDRYDISLENAGAVWLY
jgi:hypothetical protein